MNFSNINKKTMFILLEGIAAAVVLNLFSPFVQMFAKRIGAGDMDIALINSLPPLVAVLVLIPCGIIIEKANNKKFITCVLIALSGLFYLIIAFVPFIPGNIKVISYVLLIGLMNWPGSLYLTTWQSFYSDNFLGQEANSVYSVRSICSSLFGLLTVLIAGIILSAVPKNDSERIVLYQIFFLICFIVSIVQIFFLSQVGKSGKVKNENIATENEKFKLTDFKDVFLNRPFMALCLCAFAFHVAWQMGWPLFFLYNVDYIKMDEMQLGLINVSAGLFSVLSYPIWNKLISKKGSSFVIIFCALGLAINPLLYTRVWSFYVVLIVNTFGGLCGAGFTFTLFCSLLETLPQNKKTVYISFFNTLINLSGFFSPLIGMWIFKHVGIFIAFAIIGVLRILSVLTFVKRWYMNRKNINKCDCGNSTIASGL